MSPGAGTYVDALVVAATRETDPDVIVRCLRLACRRVKAEGASPAADPAVRLLTAYLASVVNGTPVPADYTALVHACHDRAMADAGRTAP